MFSITSPVRPPTPPKESGKVLEDTIRFLDTTTPLSPTAQNLSSFSKHSLSELATPPPSSPPSSPAAIRSKQIRFVSQPSFIETDIERDIFQRVQGLKKITPSGQRRATKSILKAYDPSVLSSDSSDEDSSSAPISSRTFPSLSAMLESVIQQLAGGPRSSKMDAYLATSNALKTSEPALDVDALGSKIPLLEDFIRRDVVALNPSTGSTDVKLAVQSLRLTSILLSTFDKPAHRFTNDFLGYLIDRSIYIISTPGLPKELIMTHLQLLTQDRVNTKVMSPDRASKILVALSDIHTRVSGNGIVGLRIVAFGALLARNSEVMTLGVSHWIPHIFHGMLSSLKDIRQRALAVAYVAGVSVGDTRQVSSFVQTLLAGKTSGDPTYFDHLERCLQELLASKEDSYVAPQIWSAVVGLLRNKQYGIERWPRLIQWFRILQNCFNSSDVNLNTQAWVAWTRLIYAIDLNKSTNPKLIRALRGPVISQLQRRSSKISLDRHKREALSTYYLLLYQALRPDAPFDQLDLFFEELVVPVVHDVAMRNVASAEILCQVVTALFQKTGSNLWSRDRAMSAATRSLEMEELPLLNPQWTRKNVGLLLRVFEIFLSVTDEVTADQLDLWKSLMVSVSAAGSKEITASTELRQAVAQITNTLHKWTKAPPLALRRGASLKAFHTSFWSLAQLAIINLGPTLFTDFNIRRTSDGLYEVTSTPSRTIGVCKTASTSPFLSIFEALFDSLPAGHVTRSLHSETVEVLQHCISVKTAFRDKLALLQGCAHILTKSPSAQAARGLWTALIEVTTEVLNQRSPNAGESAQRLQHDYSAASTILLAGLQHSDAQSLSFGKDFLQVIIRRSTHETRDVNVVLDIMKAFSKSLREQPSRCIDAVSSYTTTMLKDLRSVAAGRNQQAIFEMAGEHDRSTQNKISQLFTECGALLTEIYRNAYECEDLDVSPLKEMIESLTSVFRTPDANSRSLLQSAAPGMVLWIVDEKGFIRCSDTRFVELATPIAFLWKASLQLLSTMSKLGSEEIEVSESFWLAGFRSYSKRIAASTIEAWNCLVDQLESVTYPPKLRATLAQLRVVAEVRLPFFGECGDTQLSLSESQEDLLDEDLKSYFPWIHGTENQFTPTDDVPPSSKLSRPGSVFPHKPAVAHKLGSMPLTPKKASTHIAHKTPPSRLRHNDSQVQFVAVESSPIDPAEMESQMLTEHQKDVRHRHNDDAVLFSDIRSSPLVNTRSRTAARKADVESRVSDLTSISKNVRGTLTADQTAPQTSVVAEVHGCLKNMSRAGLVPTTTFDLEDVEVPRTMHRQSNVSEATLDDTMGVDVVEATALEPVPVMVVSEHAFNLQPTGLEKVGNPGTPVVTLGSSTARTAMNDETPTEADDALVEADGEVLAAKDEEDAAGEDDVRSSSSSPMTFASSVPQSFCSDHTAKVDDVTSSQTLVAQTMTQTFRAVVIESRRSPKVTASSGSQDPDAAPLSPVKHRTRRGISKKVQSVSETPNVRTRSITASFSQERPAETTSQRVMRSSKRKAPLGVESYGPATPVDGRARPTKKLRASMLSDSQVTLELDEDTIMVQPPDSPLGSQSQCTPQKTLRSRSRTSPEGSNMHESPAPTQSRRSVGHSSQGKSSRNSQVSGVTAGSPSAAPGVSPTKDSTKRKRDSSRVADEDDAGDSTSELKRTKRKRRRSTKTPKQASSGSSTSGASAVDRDDEGEGQVKTEDAAREVERQEEDAQKPQQKDVVVSPSPPSRRDRALGLIATFKTLLKDCRDLILGSQEEEERRELQDITLDWQTALVQAERKGREEDKARK